MTLDSIDEFPWSGMEPEAEYIISIDFGSSGFAASWCLPGAPSHQRMIENWEDNRSAMNLNKILAALLIDKKTKQTVAMGFEAQRKYLESQEKKEDNQYLYFQNFKPYLYS